MRKRIIIVGLALLAAVGFIVWANSRTKPAQITTTSTKESQESSVFKTISENSVKEPPKVKKTYKIANLSLIYPADWPEVNPYTERPTISGRTVEIKNANGLVRLTVSTNLSNTAETKVIDDFNLQMQKRRWIKLNIDGNEGVRSPIQTSGTRVITAYINNFDKKSQFSLILESRGVESETELNELFTDILSSIKIEKTY